MTTVKRSLRLPNVHGVIRRRLLVNFRVPPEIIQRQLPRPFVPKLHNGHAIAGICLIRLEEIRPKRFPRMLGLSSENAAHRIAVEWEQDGEQREGVFIPRRDTSSRLNTLVGGKLFPGVHHHATFTVREQDDSYRLALDSDDRQTHVLVEGSASAELPKNSIFESIHHASEFFSKGSLGYSVTARPGRFDGLELRSFNWKVVPLTINRVESSFFENQTMFPPGSVQFDCALLMRGINHEWVGRESLCSE